MRRLFHSSAVLLALVLAGCASSGPVQTGRDSWMITKQGAGRAFVTGDELKAEIYVEAGQHCSARGLVVDTVESSADNAIPFVRAARATLHFRCAAK